MRDARSTLVAFSVGSVIAAAGLAWSRSAEPPPSPTQPPGTEASVLPPGVGPPEGFREDTWFLPDEPLLGFVDVPAGPFLMGSDPASDPMAYDNEGWVGGAGPLTVELGLYAIGRYEVTVAQFRAFAIATQYEASAESLSGPPDHPVTGVSWVDALAYSRWLETQLEESERAPPELRQRLAQGWHVTLPSEFEWEKAARGVDGRIWPWGNEPDPAMANYQTSGTLPVGSRVCAGCPWGLSDMSGNVWEWTRTSFVEGPHTLATVAPDPGVDALMVMRGGSFADTEQNVRGALRGGADPGVRRPFIGFRVVLTPYAPGGDSSSQEPPPP